LDSIDDLKYGTPVAVKWWDSCRTFEERCKSDLEVCVCLYSCGWFIDADERSIRIAQDVNTENKPCTFRSVISIIRDNIEDFCVFSEDKAIVEELRRRL